MKKRKFNAKEHIIQAVLIFASVFLAFYMNKLSENFKTSKTKDVAIESIAKELHRNSEIIEAWYEKHSEIGNRINDIAIGKNDSLKTELLKHEFLNMGILTNNKNLINDILTSTAWETSKSTGIISEFETTQHLTYVYSMQQVLTEKTMMKILDFYFDMQSHNMDNLDAILIQYQLRFGELTGQEYLLRQLYKDAIKSVE